MPDGTRSYIPAAWTDFKSFNLPASDLEITLVACLADLLRTRQRVDALLRRIGATPIDPTASTQENQHAFKSNGTMVRGTAPDSAHLLTTQSRTADPPHSAFGVSDAQAGPQPDPCESSLNSKPISCAIIQKSNRLICRDGPMFMFANRRQHRSPSTASPLIANTI